LGLVIIFKIKSLKTIESQTFIKTIQDFNNFVVTALNIAKVLQAALNIIKVKQAA
jgi:hypothetical protein